VALSFLKHAADHYQQALVCSNDSDSQPALASVKALHPHLRLGLAAPVNQSQHADPERALSKDLMQACHWGKLINPEHLRVAQLPEKIDGTAIRRPAAW
jgi:hypothetical protein